jgi:hypothetical protein
VDDEPALIWTPTIDNTNYYHSSDVEASTNNGVDATLLLLPPPPPPIPNFVTPARLRKIRGSVRRATSQGSTETVANSLANQFILPVPPKMISKITIADKIDKIGHNHSEMEEAGTAIVDMCDIEVIPENDLSTIENESPPTDDGTGEEMLNKSLTLLDLSHGYTINNISTPEIHSADKYRSEEVLAEAKSDPEMVPWLNEVPKVASLKTSKSCRSLDDFISKVPSHHDCGCLSLSPASSTCSDDDIRRSATTTDGNDVFTMGTSPLRKVLSSGAINNYQSWDAFLERFHTASPFNDIENTVSLTPKRKNSIRDAMSILSSKLSPNRMNSSAQEKALEEQQRQALRVQMKDNDEFMSNFLYCSKPLDDVSQSVTTNNMDADDELAVSKTDRTTSSSTSFLCMDDNMMSCGETDNGYCCNFFFDGALTMGNILLPTSFSTRHRSTNPPNSNHHPTHQRVQSFINLGGGAPASRRESYHSESTNHHNSSSWLDLATELDGAFDTWVLGTTNQTHSTNMDDTEACLSHVSFQPPTLKKLRNIIENNSKDESDDDGEHKYDDEIWMAHASFNDTMIAKEI